MSPSILVPGQLRRKKVASAQEVICEQWVRPSQRYCLLATWVAGWLIEGEGRRLSSEKLDEPG